MDRMVTAGSGAAQRYWRLVAVVALVVLFTGTHWPSLRVPLLAEADDGPGSPSPDKLLHFVGFGLLVLPWWWTGWFPRLWILALAAGAWAIFDESMQALLPIDRTFLPEDILCNLCGVTAAVALLWGFRPVGTVGGHAELELRLRATAEGMLLRSPNNWLLLAAAAALGAVVAVPGFVLLGPLGGFHPLVMALCGGFLGAAVAGLFALSRGIEAKVAQMRQARACVWCGVPGVEGRCGGCGAVHPRGAWLETEPPRLRELAAAGWWPLLRSLLALLLASGLFLLLVADRPWAWSASLDRLYLSLNGVTRIVVDLTLLAIAGGWAIHGTRIRLAARLDAQHRSCRGCGHDLSGAPVDARTGAGRCGECGRTFRSAPVAVEPSDRDDGGSP